MSLIRQIWLLLLTTLVLAFVGSVVLIAGSARDTLQTQLRLKNSDNAAALALSLSQQKGEPELMALVLSAQFDTGFYRSIRLQSAAGKTLFERDLVQVPAEAPAWFAALLPIASEPGSAQVSDGWRALGAVQVVSQAAYAHDELWRGTLQAARALAVAGVVVSLLAALVMGRIRQPLAQTVAQAQALEAGRFITVEEPRVPELRSVAAAMNSMVMRLKAMFDAQATQVDSLRRQATCDPLTGLANRKHFMGQLQTLLHGEDGVAEGGLVLLRLLDLAEINRQIGHAATDRLITVLAQTMQTYTERVPGCHLGRLNGSDFALCLPAGGVALETAQALVQSLRVALPALAPGLAVVAGAVETQREQAVGEVMARADAALARAESLGAFAVERTEGEAGGTLAQGEGAWRQHIRDALAQSRVQLVAFPLINAAGQAIHLECPLRVQLDAAGGFEPAARWLPLALRARLTHGVDACAVRLALADIERDGLDRCINLAVASLADGGFVLELHELLSAHRGAARHLWLELPEVAAVEQFDHLQALGHSLRPLGVRVGLEHAGERLSSLSHLFEAGLDYVKLDSTIVQGVASDASRSQFVGGLVGMLHGLSLQVYAEGVSDAEQMQALWDLGIDGVTGPWASLSRPDLVGTPADWR